MTPAMTEYDNMPRIICANYYISQAWGQWIDKSYLDEQTVDKGQCHRSPDAAKIV
jgi:hypothetical protein